MWIHRVGALATTTTLLAGVWASPANSTPADNTDRVQCRDTSVNVDVLGGQTIAATWCHPAGDTAPSDVVVAVPGATYDRTYWDFPVDGYSYARAAASRGQAVLAIDRLGTGASSRPPSASVTATAQAAAIADVTEAVRADGADRVTLLGHSLGSIEAMLAEADHGADADALALTGFGHDINTATLAKLMGTQLYPAVVDPDTAEEVDGDAGYLTTRPGVRDDAFHAPGDAEPEVIAADEVTKDVVSVAESPDGALTTLLRRANQVDAPVLIANGQYDTAFCGGDNDCGTAADLHDTEQDIWDASACLSTLVAPGVGHDLGLHPDGPSVQDAVTSWSAQAARGTCTTGPLPGSEGA